MEHVVFFPGPDGVPVFRRVSSLDEAVAWVERLRNDEDLVEFSVHAVTDVPLSIRTYYKVEVPGPASVADPADDEPAAEAPVDPPGLVPALAPVATVPAQAGAPSAEAGPAEAAPAVAGPAASAEPRLGFFTS